MTGVPGRDGLHGGNLYVRVPCAAAHRRLSAGAGYHGGHRILAGCAQSIQQVRWYFTVVQRRNYSVILSWQ